MAAAATVLPKYPIYIPSKGRADNLHTARFLAEDGVPFWCVVEPQERLDYIKCVGKDRVLVLPFSNLGEGSIPARNWIKAHATGAGYARHWQLDDNIKGMRRWHGGKRIPCHSGAALRACEDFTDRYENVAISGPNYTMFAHQSGRQPKDPFWLNVHVYSASLILNRLPHQWRGRYNEDTDLCLQALAGGWCTISFNAFMVDKLRTMTMKGGNTAHLYQGDGRLDMARSLERVWPGVVTTGRRFKRPQHKIHSTWKKFDTPLKLRADLDLDALAQTQNEYGMRLVQVADEVKSPRLRALLEEAAESQEESETDDDAATR